jgi:hypothetical protein
MNSRIELRTIATGIGGLPAESAAFVPLRAITSSTLARTFDHRDRGHPIRLDALAERQWRRPRLTGGGLPVIVGLKRWREKKDLIQSEAFRLLNEAGIRLTLEEAPSIRLGVNSLEQKRIDNESLVLDFIKKEF